MSQRPDVVEMSGILAHSDPGNTGAGVATDDDFDAIMAQIGVDPLARPAKRAAAPSRVHKDAPPHTSQSSPVAKPNPQAVARGAELAAARADLAAARAELDGAGAEIARLTGQIAAISAQQDVTQERLAAAAEAATHLQKHADDLDRERRALQRRLGEVTPVAVTITPAVDVFAARGLRAGKEQHDALIALCAQRPAGVLAALQLADAGPLAQLLDQRVVLASHGAELADDNGHVMVRVAHDRCEFGGASDLAAAWRRFVAACEATGVRTITIVGGSPSYRKQLRALADTRADSPKLVLVSGTQRRPKNKAASDLRTSDLVLIWGATELDHSVSAPYTGGGGAKVKIIAHRGISGMLDRACKVISSGTPND